MNTSRSPRELAIDLLPRSICKVQVAAVLADNHGIFAWGWNSIGNGSGQHAETHAISRASRERLKGATIYIASQRRWNKKPITSKPCPDCWGHIESAWLKKMVWREAGGIVWQEYWL